MTIIRPIIHHDIEDVQSLASDPAIAASANLPAPYPIDGAAAWYERISHGVKAGRQVVFAVVSKDLFVGVMSLNGIDLSHGGCSLYYWIGKPHWGQGHATKAAAKAISYAASILGVSSITSGCLKDNLGSKRVLEKSGFRFTAESGYKGPFMDRFGGLRMLHCDLALSRHAPNKATQTDAFGGADR